MLFYTIPIAFLPLIAIMCHENIYNWCSKETWTKVGNRAKIERRNDREPFPATASPVQRKQKKLENDKGGEAIVA